MRLPWSSHVDVGIASLGKTDRIVEYTYTKGRIISRNVEVWNTQKRIGEVALPFPSQESTNVACSGY